MGRADAEAEAAIQRADSLEKTLMLDMIEGKRRRGWQRMRQLDSITDSMTWIWAEFRKTVKTRKPGVLQSMGSQRVGHDWETELTDWLFQDSSVQANGFFTTASSPKIHKLFCGTHQQFTLWNSLSLPPQNPPLAASTNPRLLFCFLFVLLLSHLESPYMTLCEKCESVSHSVVSDSLQPYGL